LIRSGRHGGIAKEIKLEVEKIGDERIKIIFN
jgi:hypothetical protein